MKLIADELKEYPEIDFRWVEKGLQFQVQFIKKIKAQPELQSELQSELKSELQPEQPEQPELQPELQPEYRNAGVSFFNIVKCGRIDSSLFRHHYGRQIPLLSGRLNLFCDLFIYLLDLWK